jgi:hypothetical protein
MSGVSHEGIQDVLRELWREIARHRTAEAPDEETGPWHP